MKWLRRAAEQEFAPARRMLKQIQEQPE